MWTNIGFDISEESLGARKFQDLLRKKREATPTCVQNLLGRSALSLASHEAIKQITRKKSKVSPFLERHNAVGAVGYAHVSDDNVLQSCDFFKPERCFKIRFRASNVNCEDDAASCVREVAIKFSDQDRDGFFDLFFYTGRTFLARDSSEFLKLISMSGTDKEIQQLCKNNPYMYRSLADGLRRAPKSVADLTYYSQICYLFSKSKKDKMIVKFRLIPSYKAGSIGQIETFSESVQMEEIGMLTPEEQKQLWNRSRKKDETREATYLKQEFKERLWNDEPVSFTLQVQMKPFGRDYQDDCNPQLIWNEAECPWSRVMVIELTTHMTTVAIARTMFNISDSPKALGFPEASGPQDPFSLQKVMMSVYTEIERKGLSQMCFPVKGAKSDEKTKSNYVVTVCTEPLKGSKQVPYVEVYITIWGSRCRSCALGLNLDNRLNFKVRERNFRVNQHRLMSESVGELINITVDVYHRHLTESWYLRDVEVYDENLRKLWSFPCYEVVEGSITLEPGDVRLVHKQTAEVSKKERNFQLNSRQLEYTWNKESKEASKDSESTKRIRMPGQIRNPEQVDKLPQRFRTRGAKYKGIRWEVDPKLIDFFREFNSSVMTHGNVLTRKLQAKMKKSKVLKSRNKTDKKPPRNHLHEVDHHATSTKRASISRLFSRDVHFVAAKFKNTNTNNNTGMVYNNLSKNTNLSKKENSSYSDGLHKIENKRELFKRSKCTSVSDTDYRYVKPINYARDECDGHGDIESKLPEGSLGDMCRTVLKDEDFGHYFLIGSNPTVIERCRALPAHFPVTSSMVYEFLEGYQTLEEEIKEGRVYIADYKILSGLPTVHQEADHRFIAAPLVLLHVTSRGKLMPLAIQLEQVPSPDNCIWTPSSNPEAWMLAKLWVRCCDFNHQFAISHLFNCHFLMEPFLVATMRCLPSNHPCYKILMPHFRYLLVSNSLIRHNVLSENGSVDRHTSLGRNGFQKLMERHWRNFNFELLNPIKCAEKRGVADEKLLPGYFYRDDSRRIFNCIHKCCSNLIKIHYPSIEDYNKDLELKTWLLELIDFGFPGHLMTCPYSSSLHLVPSAPPLSPEKRVFDFDAVHSKNIIPEEKPGDGIGPPKYVAEGGYDEIDVADSNEDSDDEYEDVDYSDKSLAKGQGNCDIAKSKIFKHKKKKKTSNIEMLKVSNPGELAEMLATIIFTVACQHSATHSDALDLFGFIPDVPAMMRKSPKTSNFCNIDVDSLTHTLPDQYPEAYYASLLFILNVYKPDQNILGELDEVYFVDDESWEVLKSLKKRLRELTTEHRARNITYDTKYECLVPQYIPASPEPLPYIPNDLLEKATQYLGPTMTVGTFLEQVSMGTVSAFLPEQCLTFHETLGGRSSRGVLGRSTDDALKPQGKRNPLLKTFSVNYSDGDDYRMLAEASTSIRKGSDFRPKLLSNNY